jgi:hypothetical protein
MGDHFKLKIPGAGHSMFDKLPILEPLMRLELLGPDKVHDGVDVNSTSHRTLRGSVLSIVASDSRVIHRISMSPYQPVISEANYWPCELLRDGARLGFRPIQGLSVDPGASRTFKA